MNPRARTHPAPPPGDGTQPIDQAESRSTSKLSTGRGLLLASTLMAAGTLISRVLGLVRQSLQMGAIGGNVKGDIFAMATTLPNQVYVLIAGGTLNAILVPLIVRATKEDPDKGEAYINRLGTLFLLVMGVTTVVCLLATPALLHINNPIWFDADHKAELANLTLLTYLTMPQVFFFGVFFIASQVLNARERFGPMMWAPIANNLIAILTFIVYSVVTGEHNDKTYPTTPYTSQEVMILGLGSTVGIIAQAACTVVFLRSAGVRYRPRFDFRGTGLGRTFHVAKWVILTVVVGFVAQTLVNAIASGATGKSPDGAGQAVLSQATLIWMMPHGLITVSITTALLPAITDAFAENNPRRARDEIMRSVKLTNVMMIPISLALLVFALPIAQLIFGYDRGRESVPAMAWTLAAYAIGLPLFTLSFVLCRALYALEDTLATLKLGSSFDTCWVAMAFLLVVPFDAPRWTAPALGLAYSIASIPQLVVTFKLVRKRMPQLSIADVMQHTIRVLLATLPAAIVAGVALHFLVNENTSKFMTLLWLVVCSGVAAALYYVGARVFRIPEVADLVNTVLRRGRPGLGSVATSPDDELTQTIPTVESPTLLFERTATPRRVTEEAVSGEVMSDSAAPVEIALCDPEPTVEDPDARISQVATGNILADRYRLTQFLNRRGTTQLWRAFDEALSRQVLLHILAPENPRSSEILTAARRAATATDSRFLRVLDAVHSDDPDVGAYIVCEHVIGQSLTEMLEHGVLSALEAGWVVHEVADGISLMHAGNLFHGRLNPDNVVITSSGNVKVVGFGIEAAMFPHPGDDQLSDLEWASSDVESLGKLLYACLVAEWPGGELYGMDAAPREEGRWLTPARVQAGISPALDQICDQILSRPPRGGLPALRSANDVMVALERVLGSANAAGDLERRVANPPRGGRSTLPGSNATGGDTPRAARQGRQEVNQRVDSAVGSEFRSPVPTPTGQQSGGDAAGNVPDTTGGQRAQGSETDATAIQSAVGGPDQAAGQAGAQPGNALARIPARGSGRSVAESPRQQAGAGVPATTPHQVTDPSIQLAQPGAAPGFTAGPGEAGGAPDPAPKVGDAAVVGGEPGKQPPLGQTPRIRRAAAHNNGKWMMVLVVILALALLIGAAATASKLQEGGRRAGGGDRPASPGATTSTGTVQQRTIVGAKDFDPEGSGGENPGEVANAIDGNYNTAWHTEVYRSASLGNTVNNKTGVGVYVELASVQRISSVKVTTVGSTNIQVRVPNPDTEVPEAATTWVEVANKSGANGTVEMKLSKPRDTHYILIWLTSVPSVGAGQYQGAIAEIEVFG